MDELFMNLAIEEAKKGTGRTSPNPCVGAVIVKDGRVIGQGYHRKAGSPHGEINAINSATESLKGATIYVTLEPCSHQGRTPPCCHALVAAGFARVVVGMTDPNPLVNGRGIAYLLESGLDVSSGVLSDKCAALNNPFIKHVTTGLPWMIMKAGLSLDGRLNYQRGQSGWITGRESGLEVHKLRDSVDAILVGRNTVEIDNPSLTTRLANRTTRDPVRIIVDSGLCSPLSAKLFHLDSDAPTWIICSSTVPQQRRDCFLDLGVELFPVPLTERGLDLESALLLIGRKDICSVLVEGGARIHGALLRERLYDYAHLFYAPLFAGDGGVPLLSGYDLGGREMAPKIVSPTSKKLGDDIMISGRITYNGQS